MQSEDLLWRRPPTTPYRPGTAVLLVPHRAVAATTQMLQRFGRLEACVFWFGTRSADGGVVEGVLAPAQRMSWGNYAVEPEAMIEMANNLPSDVWRPLAQVHSHPGAGVEHSTFDDKMVSSKRILSLVFPAYGRWSATWPRGIGVHEHQDGYWHLLKGGDAANRARLVDGDVFALDLRR